MRSSRKAILVFTLLRSIVRFAAPVTLIAPLIRVKLCTSTLWVFLVVTKFRYEAALSRLQATVVIADELELLLELGAIDDEDTTDDETAELLVCDDDDAADDDV